MLHIVPGLFRNNFLFICELFWNKLSQKIYLICCNPRCICTYSNKKYICAEEAQVRPYQEEVKPPKFAFGVNKLRQKNRRTNRPRSSLVRQLRRTNFVQAKFANNFSRCITQYSVYKNKLSQLERWKCIFVGILKLIQS